jgi:HSP20 family protein
MKRALYRPAWFDRTIWPAPVAELSPFGRMFDDVFGRVAPTEGSSWWPAVDVVDRDDELLLTAELPGMKKDAVDIDVADGVLTLKGEKREEREKEEQNYRVVERSYGTFERSFTLPRSVNAAKIRAEFLDGVLKIHLPKAEQTHGRRVEIAG